MVYTEDEGLQLCVCICVLFFLVIFAYQCVSRISNKHDYDDNSDDDDDDASQHRISAAPCILSLRTRAESAPFVLSIGNTMLLFFISAVCMGYFNTQGL